MLDDVVEYRRHLFNLRGRCAHVEGCDVDEAVLSNPFVDHAEVIAPDGPLPYADNSFDIIFARFVFEHVQNAEIVANELTRVLKPGGLIASLTPNKYGYIAAAGTLVPNRLHVKALKAIQPKRKAVDVFPTKYRLNSRSALMNAFGDRVNIHLVYASGEPAYHFGKPWLYRVFKFLHKHMPDRIQPLLIIFIVKPDAVHARSVGSP
ncbi:class I SAM-dependent methyltransferase [Mycolicibacterium sp. S2-37]|uniref:class I SAM-dependent methyltransferase n=1 Tax=Mycolicibacterium sp. S2-37 TaxID=2810297 RepID=UPI0027DA7C9D|nr:class I SAM-dependent methyltransferase [Mycolicibacterium sp. S2-37]